MDIYRRKRRESVIDYVIGGEEIWEKVGRIEIKDRIDSDHHPLMVWMKGREEVSGKEGKRGGKIKRWNWEEGGVEEFRKNMGEVKEGQGKLKEM